MGQVSKKLRSRFGELASRIKRQMATEKQIFKELRRGEDGVRKARSGARKAKPGKMVKTEFQSVLVGRCYHSAEARLRISAFCV